MDMNMKLLHSIQITKVSYVSKGLYLLQKHVLDLFSSSLYSKLKE
jgi:hypothetical protein